MGRSIAYPWDTPLFATISEDVQRFLASQGMLSPSAVDTLDNLNWDEVSSNPPGTSQPILADQPILDRCFAQMGDETDQITK